MKGTSSVTHGAGQDGEGRPSGVGLGNLALKLQGTVTQGGGPSLAVSFELARLTTGPFVVILTAFWI